MNRTALIIGAGLLILAALGGLGMSLAEAFIARREGFKATPYTDQAGYLTIGYGHKIQPGESFPSPITQQEGLQLLRQDMAKAEAAVNANVHVMLNANQRAALVSFAYNVGIPAFIGSTLLRMLNAGDYAGASAQFPLWDHIHADGHVVVDPGLLARRNAEAVLFGTPVGVA